MSNFVPSGYLIFSDALDRVASALHIQKREAQKTLRQLLHSGQVPSRIIERSGQEHDTPAHVWGGMKWREAIKSGAVCFEVAAYAPDAHGRILIPQSRLIETLKSRIPQKTETYQRDKQIYKLFKATSAANPQAKRERIFEKMRVKEPGLFMNRREAVSNTQISNQTIARIIREQQR